MAMITPSIYINDDEVDFKLIYVCSTKFNNPKKYTISEAERLGLVKIETGSFLLGNLKYSINGNDYDSRQHHIISNASCTT
jgi:glyceraldehyde-3-phosphate dehydrogenase/erythrose-4-phosphate dehydrogenase